MEDIKRKRAQIAKLIEHLAQVEHQGGLQLPSLQFESPVRRSTRKRRKNLVSSDEDFVEEVPSSVRSLRNERSRTGRQTRRQTRTTEAAASAEVDVELSQVRE